MTCADKPVADCNQPLLVIKCTFFFCLVTSVRIITELTVVIRLLADNNFLRSFSFLAVTDMTSDEQRLLQYASSQGHQHQYRAVDDPGDGLIGTSKSMASIGDNDDMSCSAVNGSGHHLATHRKSPLAGCCRFPSHACVPVSDYSLNFRSDPTAPSRLNSIAYVNSDGSFSRTKNILWQPNTVVSWWKMTVYLVSDSEVYLWIRSDKCSTTYPMCGYWYVIVEYEQLRAESRAVACFWQHLILY